MKMKQIKYLLLIAVVAFAASCKQDYKKTKSGVSYIIYPGDGKVSLKSGDIIKFSITAKVKDSVLIKAGAMPGYAQVDTSREHFDFNDVVPLMKEGDSAVVSVSIDSLIAKGMLQPGFAGSKKGDLLMFYIRVIKAFKTQDEAKADFETENKKAGDASVKALEDYLAKNNIKATKTAKGTFVEVVNPGTDPKIDSANYVTMKYTGMLLDGKKFDSNVDTAFHHVEPFSFTVDQQQVIQGWDDGLKMFGKGGKGRLFIPSFLGYGAQGSGDRIPANSNLIFEVEVIDMQAKAPAPKPQAGGGQIDPSKMTPEQQKQMQEAIQQQMQQQAQQQQQSPH
jgi:FKBP-type peptidyl-prolyl cis-trans isomerase FkpA